MSFFYLVSVLVASRPQMPVSPFNGTWLMEIPSSKSAEPESFSLSRGIFSRGDDKSKITIKADGNFHSIPDDGYVDAISVIILGPRELREQDRLKGKLVYSVTYRVSVDGKTLTRKVVDFSKPNKRPIPTVITDRRIDKYRPSVSLISGRWQKVDIKTTRSHLTENIKLIGSRFISSKLGGAGYDAAIGGPPVPVKGDAADARVAVSMPNDRTAVIDMSRNGRSTVRMTMVLLPNDRTIKVIARRISDGTDTQWLLRRQ